MFFRNDQITGPLHGRLHHNQNIFYLVRLLRFVTQHPHVVNPSYNATKRIGGAEGKLHIFLTLELYGGDAVVA
jgi:hypothetical protein